MFSELAVLGQLLIAFLRVGVLGFGGGPSFIPLVEIEVVNNFRWFTPDQFSEMLGFGYALPGPIATKIAGYVGYKVAGIAGAVVALAGLVLPSLVAMVALLAYASSRRGVPWLEGMGRAIQPLVAVLLAVLVWETVAASVEATGPGLTLGIALAALVALQFLHLHPAVVVVAVLAFGAMAVR